MDYIWDIKAPAMVMPLKENKEFYDENRVALLQYESLREHFNLMITNILGDDYYNLACDVYDADRMCCEDITNKAKERR